MTTIAFHQRAFEDFTQWEKVDKEDLPQDR